MTTDPADHARPAWPPHHAPPPVARLAIAPHADAVRRIDGVWWPHSTDLLAELPELLSALPFDWPRITHVTVNGTGWPAFPAHILVSGHVIRLRRTATRRPGPDTICLVSTGHGRWDLAIIPPGTPEPEAVRTMAEMARTGEPSPA
ncbi:hypothetical protein SSP35_03_01870 [Streptomyces sp. NBRC 110611]|uniref:DUF5994 family protein n=1 Tax=Streptomyces sp. NBRC 110611 TaxID=1621259 RepID=UPI0008377F21|nr:DUF5994 family protein [Streptomyces sp. NBRC 110611]GAU66539.1 hypothetical protein SSP35_03_01870 [Streptomyces sp. NBRC 110611]